MRHITRLAALLLTLAPVVSLGEFYEEMPAFLRVTVEELCAGAGIVLLPNQVYSGTAKREQK